MVTEILDSDAVILRRLKERRESAPMTATYLSFFSSWLGGIIRDPKWMMIPLDDHLVHRGDGVFEALRGIGGSVIDMRGHLDRLERSSSMIGLKNPYSRSEVEEILLSVARAAGVSDLMLRVYLSRGPGGFTPNPYDSKEPLFFVVATIFSPVKPELVENGASLRLSSIEAKAGFFAQIKSCNYLPNVLMKKEAVESGYDFSVAIDRDGRVTEGPTENLIFLSSRFELCVPKFDYTLRGTTLMSVIEDLRSNSIPEIRDVVIGDFVSDDLFQAREIAMVGTTLEVLPVTRFGSRPVGDGKPGPVMCALRERLRSQMVNNRSLRTPW